MTISERATGMCEHRRNQSRDDSFGIAKAEPLLHAMCEMAASLSTSATGVLAYLIAFNCFFLLRTPMDEALGPATMRNPRERAPQCIQRLQEAHRPGISTP